MILPDEVALRLATSTRITSARACANSGQSHADRTRTAETDLTGTGLTLAAAGAPAREWPRQTPVWGRGDVAGARNTGSLPSPRLTASRGA